jgi:hypothetical protein
MAIINKAVKKYLIKQRLGDQGGDTVLQPLYPATIASQLIQETAGRLLGQNNFILGSTFSLGWNAGVDVDVSETAPLSPNIGDQYFNEENDTLFTYTEDGEWSSVVIPTAQPSDPTFGTRWFNKTTDTLFTYVNTLATGTEGNWTTTIQQASQDGNIILTLPAVTGTLATEDYVINNIPTLSTTSNLLDSEYDDGNIRFEPFSSTIADATWVGDNDNAGKLYLGTQAAVKATRLNYNGEFYATNLYSGGNLVLTGTSSPAFSTGQAFTSVSIVDGELVFDSEEFLHIGKAANGETPEQSITQTVYGVKTFNSTITGSISGNAGTVTTSADTENAENFVLFGVTNTGAQAPKTSTTLKYNPSTGNISATTFTGALSGNASSADQIKALASTSTDQHFLTFVDSNNSTAANESILTSANISIQPSTGDITTLGDINVNGGDIKTTATTFNLLNTTATTVNAFGAATTTNIGYNGTTTDSIVNISSGVITDEITKTINIGSSGASGSITNINLGSQAVGAESTVNIYGTLNVSGIVNSISTEEFKLEDNTITLNSNINDSPITGWTAGIRVRVADVGGNPAYKSLFWDHDDQRWEIDGNPISVKNSSLGQFAATTSAELAGIISDETGSGALVFGTSPVLTTPDINGGTANSLTSLSIRDTSAEFDVTITGTSSTTLNANRTLTLDLVNDNRSIKLTGSPTLSGITTTGAGTLALNKNLTVNTNNFTLDAAGADRTLKISTADKEIAGAATVLTFGGNFTTSGAHTTIFTTTGNTSVTLPTTGTLATLAGNEALTNKTVNGLTLTAATVGFTIAGGTTTSKTLTINEDSNIGALGDGHVLFASSANTISSEAQLATSRGGTGLASFNNNGAVYATSTSVLTTGTLPIASGGTSATTKAGAFNALSPMTTLGDIIYGGASGTGTRLSGEATTTRKFLRSVGDGTNSTAPAWDTLVNSDLPNSGVTASTYSTVAVNTKGIVTSGGQLIEIGGATPNPSYGLVVGGLFFEEIAA